MSKEHGYVGNDSLVFDAKSNKYLLCGEVIPQTWRSAGFDPIKKKIQETNAMIFACRNGGTLKEFRKKNQKMMKIKKTEGKHFSMGQNQVDSSQVEGPSGKLISPVNMTGKKMTFAEAVRAVIMHRRCSKIKALAFLSQLPTKKKEAKLKDLRCFLDSLVHILRALCNLRDKDLRTKVVLPRVALKQLRQESGHLSDMPSASNRRKSTLIFEGKESVEEETDSVKSWDDLVSFKSSCFDDNTYSVRRKLPLWQIIAMEYVDSNKNWTRVGGRTAEKDSSHNLCERITAGWNLVRARQAYDSRYVVRNIDRMEHMRNRIQLTMIRKSLSCVERYRQMVSEAVPKSNIIDLNEKELEKMSWCYNLEDLCHNFIDSDPDVRFPQLETLKRFSLLDFTKVNFVKAKLCLYVLSLPANEILSIPTQKSLLFALSSILQLSKSILKQWMDSRHLPLYDVDPLAK